jgi:hypothetical protein
LYAVVRAAFACCVAASFGSGSVWFVPVNVTQFAAGQAPNPVSEDVGDDPTSPRIVLAPVLVIPEPARIAKLPAVPSNTGVGVTAWAVPASTQAAGSNATPTATAAAPKRTRREPGTYSENVNLRVICDPLIESEAKTRRPNDQDLPVALRPSMTPTVAYITLSSNVSRCVIMVVAQPVSASVLRTAT